MIEDTPPNIPASPVPDELTDFQQRKTLLPAAEVDSRMVALSLSSMATTLERIEGMLASIPELTRAVRAMENRQEQFEAAVERARGTANLAGGIAAAAREDIEAVRQMCERIETMVGRLALSIQGLDERSASVYNSVFPQRDSPSTPPEVEFADIVPLRGRHSNTGE